MTELLNTGKRIRRLRILRGMTQKTLGMAVGFSAESADIRIAQYESGTRKPKRSMICLLAQALGVSPSALAVPRIQSAEELCSLLIALEDGCGIKLSLQSDNAAAIFESPGERSKAMKTYEVTITETLQKTVEVEAASREQAEELVEQKWNDSEYILDAEAFVGVDFDARTKERSRDYER